MHFHSALASLQCYASASSENALQVLGPSIGSAAAAALNFSQADHPPQPLLVENLLSANAKEVKSDSSVVEHVA